MQSRRVLVIGGVVAAIFVVIALTTFIFKGGDPYESTCEKFISYIEKQQPDKGYNLFSPVAKSTMSQKEWQAQVKAFETTYANGKATLTNTVDVTPQKDGKPGKNTQKRLSYKVVTPGNTFSLNCTVLKSGGYLVNGFYSGPSERTQ